ncbi:pyrroline-5-carboxylate reductase [Pontibacter sp. E15-1]|uniref:pyrroline-5-carboxylate reductase n=1 Tax=Pontibacter sp. E15-1 TaxID=2919918 RepID=UPI001F4FB32D|nr:pyrroline-5-carboxylate reductase [Pontibacter sp. E15-1]MCJ8165024.1 pyrroline-5-carboxylate reductase [Pontibacter sp. E15-1]
MYTDNVAILGAGNLGNAIAVGLLSNGKYEPENIYVTRRNTKSLQPLKDKGLHVSNDNSFAVKNCRYILLCVQPAHLEHVLKEIKPILDPEKHVLLSVIAGVTIANIHDIVGDFPIVRCMPNTAIAVQESMTSLAFNDKAAGVENAVQEIFNCLGETLVIEEELMAGATVLCSSGIAFNMRFIRAVTQGGIQLGLDAEDAQKIAVQVSKGASTLLTINKSHPEQEIDKVTTPEGCTITGLNEMEHQGLSSAVIKGLVGSHQRILALKEQRERDNSKLTISALHDLLQ